MSKRATLYFSNKIEELIEALGEELFQKGRDPFRKKVVIIPHHSFKPYLQFFFASHPKRTILAGVTFQTLFEAIGEITEKKLFSLTALALLLEKKIEKKELFHSKKKKQWVAKELASLFLEIYLFEPAAFSFWIKENGWKQELYLEIFGKNSIADFLEGKKVEEDTHLFAFSYLQPHFSMFFAKHGARFYLTSPTEMFWEDLCSDKERIYIEKKMELKHVQRQVQEEISFFLKQRDPLLANFGQVGRSFLRFFAEKECFLVERYKAPNKKNALGILQKSLFYLERETKEQLFSDDTSFLLQSASSKLREVEILLETLQELMHKDSVEPKNVLVLCLSIEAYAPYIEAVFGRKSSPYSYAIHGVSPLFCYKETRQVSFFLDWLEGRFELAVFLEALPLFKKKWEFQEKDFRLFSRALEKAGVLWGLNQEHKAAHLLATSPYGKDEIEIPLGGTLLEGLQKIFLSLATEVDEPLIGWTDVEAFGKLAHMIDWLAKELVPVYKQEEKEFSAWREFLVKVAEKFLETTPFLEGFFSFTRAVEEELLGEGPFMTFSRFKEVIGEYFLQKKESIQAANLGAIKFLQLEPDGIYPADIIYILGADEETVSRVVIPSSLDDVGVRITPSPADFSRYLFLQCIIHARISLVFSYERISPKDGKEQPVSRFIEDFFSHLSTIAYVEESSLPSSVFRRDHPALAFAKAYFAKKSAFHAYSPALYEKAKSYYMQQEKKASSFLCEVEKETKNVVDIKEIEFFARSPARSYLKESLGMPLSSNQIEEKEFFLSAKDKYIYSRKALRKDLAKGVYAAQKNGTLPLGIFGKIGEIELEKTLKTLQEGLSHFSLIEKDLFVVELVSGVRNVQKEEGKITVPSIKIEVEEDLIEITGHLYPISNLGMVFLGEKKDEGLFWPLWLIYLLVAPLIGLPSSLLFLQEKEEKANPPKEPRKWLASYLKLYRKGMKIPYLQKKIAIKGMGYIDPYEKFIADRESDQRQEELVKDWEQDSKEVFAFLREEEDFYA